MNSRFNSSPGSPNYVGPNLGAVAIAYVALKIASVIPVSYFGTLLGVRPPYFPGLLAPIDEVANYFATHAGPVSLSAFLQFGAAIPFGIFVASVVNSTSTLGLDVVGIRIALFGGIMAAIDEAISGSIIWTMGHPVIAQVPAITQTLHYLAVVLGGPGFTMPQGLLMAGISIAAGRMKKLPKTMVVFGLVLAVIGELSWLSMLSPIANILIPLARWPGFIWLIVAGFQLSKRGTIPAFSTVIKMYAGWDPVTTKYFPFPQVLRTHLVNHGCSCTRTKHLSAASRGQLI